jgi:hypothetical protein
MSDKVDTIIEQAARNTVRDFPEDVDSGGSGGLRAVRWMAHSGIATPPWWSPARDVKLRDFWKKSDHLSGAVYAMTSKMTAIPRRVVARDESIKEHVEQAAILTQIMQQSAEFGDGWETFFGAFVEDLLTQDNGAFAEIIGPGSPTGPITGVPISLSHLDSNRCQRTGDPEFPVIYTDTKGQRYKLHYTRVMFTAQMPSPIAEMYGVGFCAVSRAINVAQTLIDILNYKQEKLGSRPHRAILITKGGLDPDDVTTAFQAAESNMDNQGLTRYSKVVVAGNAAMPESGLEMIELSKLPEGFDEETSINYGMATVALAFGVDARELFPAMQSGATRADAMLSHLKQRGKGPGQIIQTVEQLFDHKYLPPHLQLLFDFQDDAQDRQEAEIEQVRANRSAVEIGSGSVSVRVAREQMLEVRDISRSQFNQMELQDGRLPDGASILTLFYSKDKRFTKFLDLGIDDPLDKDSNSEEGVSVVIHEQIREANSVLINSDNPDERSVATHAVYALAYLKKFYSEEQELHDVIVGNPYNLEGDDVKEPDKRLRTEDGQSAKPAKEPGRAKPHTDDSNTQPEKRNTRIKKDTQ